MLQSRRRPRPTPVRESRVLNSPPSMGSWGCAPVFCPPRPAPRTAQCPRRAMARTAAQRAAETLDAEEHSVWSNTRRGETLRADLAVLSREVLEGGVPVAGLRRQAFVLRGWRGSTRHDKPARRVYCAQTGGGNNRFAMQNAKQGVRILEARRRGLAIARRLR
jgi:hypothetical protein